MTRSVKDVICFDFYHRVDLTSGVRKSGILTLAVTIFESVKHSDRHTLQCNLFWTPGVTL